MVKHWWEIITILTLLIFYNTYANTTLKFYVNDFELLEDDGKTNWTCTYTTVKNGTLDVEELKNDIANIANKVRNYGNREKINCFIEGMIGPNDLIFSKAAIKRSSGVLDDELKIEEDNKINLDNYDNTTIEIYYITKQKVEEIKNLKIDQITLNGEKLNIDENNFQFFKDIEEKECKTCTKITEYIEKQTKNLEDVKTATNGFRDEEIDVDLSIRIYSSFEIIKNTKNIGQKGTEITIRITAQHKASYQIKYVPPEGVTLRDYREDENIYVFDKMDSFGEDICVPKTISVKYIGKNNMKNNDGKTVKQQIIHQLENIYNEYESNPELDLLNRKLHEKAMEYKNKINNGNNIKLPASKNWNTLEPGDTIEVELSEKSELVKSLIVPVEINPPEGHQLAGILGKQNTIFVTITDINSIDNKDNIKEALKNKLSEMRIDVNGKRLEIPQETINTAIDGIEYDYDGMLKTCNTQIPIGAGDFIATKQEIEQREQKKQNKNKKPQQIGMSEGTARCCACCNKCCKCNGGCCTGG